MKKILLNLLAALAFALPSFAFATTPTLTGTPAYWNPNLAPSATLSYTMGTGSNLGLVVTFVSDTTDWNPGGGDTATYAGVSPTSVTTYAGTAVFDTTVMFFANPATGANNLVLTRGSGNTATFGITVSGWQDIAQSGVIDTETHAGASGSHTNTSVNITPTVNNTSVLIILGAYKYSGSTTDQGSQTRLTSGTMSGAGSDSTFVSYLPVVTAALTSVGYNASFPDSTDLFAVSLKSPSAVVATPLPVSNVTWW